MLHPASPSQGSSASFGPIPEALMRSLTAPADTDADGSPPPGLGQIGARDFERLATFIQNYSGIKMPASKRTMLEGRLRRRLRLLDLPTFDAYCRYLFDDEGLDDEAAHLIDVVTTNKTDFFREPEHFDILMSHLLPALLEAGRGRPGTPIKIWSAASSTGAEAYTLAMLMAEARRRIPDLTTFILGTDICHEVLKSAVDGIYPEAMLEPIPDELRRLYIRRGRGRARGQFRLVPELRAQVHFGRLNLMDQSYPVDRDMDLIFCRNVLIYFDKPTQQRVLERLTGHLRPGGYLVLGHSESFSGRTLPLKQVIATIFRKV